MTSIAITIPNNALPFATSSVSSPPPSMGVAPTVTLAVGVATVLFRVSVVVDVVFIITLPVDGDAFMEGEASSEDGVIVSLFVVSVVAVDVVVGEGSVVLLVDVLLVMLVVINKSITFCCLYMISLDLFSSTPNFFISSFRTLDCLLKFSFVLLSSAFSSFNSCRSSS